MEQGLLFEVFHVAFGAARQFYFGSNTQADADAVFAAPPAVTGTVSSLDCSNPAEFESTFGTVALGSACNVAMRLRGFVFIPVAGEYTFDFPTNDDISYLFLDAAALAPEPQLDEATLVGSYQGPSSVSVTLAAGFHPLLMLYGNQGDLTVDGLSTLRLGLVPTGATVQNRFSGLFEDGTVQFFHTGTQSTTWEAVQARLVALVAFFVLAWLLSRLVRR
jgi:hypothetical protein